MKSDKSKLNVISIHSIKFVYQWQNLRLHLTMTTDEMSIIGLLFAPTESAKQKHWKNGLFSNLELFVQQDLTSNLLIYNK